MTRLAGERLKAINRATGLGLVALSLILPTSAWARPDQTQPTAPNGPIPRASIDPANVFTTGIEVTQGIQQTVTPYYDSAGKLSPTICATQPSLAVRDASPSGITEPLHYAGVKLERDRRTVVRLFAHPLSQGPQQTNRTVKDVTAVLYGFRGAASLPGSPLMAEDGPRDLSTKLSPWTTCRDRADPRGSYTFTLPRSWRHGNITLRGQTIPDAYLYPHGGECETKYCKQDNSLELRDVQFRRNGYVNVTPVELTYKDGATLRRPPPPGEVIADSKYAMPTDLRYTGGGDDDTYAGVIRIDDEVNDDTYKTDTRPNRKQQCIDIKLKLIDWADSNPHGEITFGVFDPVKLICVGLAGGSLVKGQAAYPVVTSHSLTHEIGHNFGREHADPPGACGGDGQQWPPDQQGQMHGIGTDVRTGSGGKRGLYKIVLSGDLLPGDPFKTGQDPILYDMMSYCGKIPKRFLQSDVGWDQAFDGVASFLRDFFPSRLGGAVLSRARAQTAQTGRVLRVRVAVDNPVPRILSIRPLNAGKPLTPGASVYSAVFRASGGGVVAAVPMTGVPEEIVGADGPLGQGAIASVEILRDGAVVAKRVRSPNPPTASVTKPSVGDRLDAGPMTVTWRATDADNDRLKVAIDYSRNGGRTWQHVFAGPNAGSIELPRRLFGGSQNARIRVRVNDGFNETSAVSGLFAVEGLKPQVRITSPSGSMRTQSDVNVVLTATSHEELGILPRVASVTWFDGKRELGRGLDMSARLGPGLRHLRVEVKGRNGLSSVSVLDLRVRGARPRVLSFRGPDRLSPKTKRLEFTIATTIKAALRVGAQSFKVSPKPRTVRVRVKPGSGELRLPVRIVAGRTTRSTIVVPR